MSLQNPTPNSHAEAARQEGLRWTELYLAAQDLESATQAARRSRELLRRATRNRLQAKERHADAKLNRSSSDRSRVRVELARWALENAERDEHDALNDYRAALARVTATGLEVAPADAPDAPSRLRHRARKAIAEADAFGNKVAMDATLYDDLQRPDLPELSPAVEEGEDGRLIDPLEPVQAPPAERAVLIPVDDYTAAKIQEGNIVAASIDGEDLEDPDDDGAAVPAGERLETEAERFAFWREVNGAALEDEEKALEGAREDDEEAGE